MTQHSFSPTARRLTTFRRRFPQPLEQYRWVLGTLAAVLLLQAAAWTIVRLRDLLLIVLVAWLLALAIEPVIAWCGRRGLRRGPAAALILLSGVAALAGFLAVFPGVDRAWVERRLAQARARGLVEWRDDGTIALAPGAWLHHDAVGAQVLR